MKKHINKSQLGELSKDARTKLKEWWKPKKGDWVWDRAEASGFGSSMDSHDEKYEWEKSLIIESSSSYGSYEPDTTREKKTGARLFYDEYDGSESHLSDDGLPLLSCGQLIEFLDEKYGCRFDILKIVDEPKYGRNGYRWYVELKSWESKRYKELCDALFEAVKEELLK